MSETVAITMVVNEDCVDTGTSSDMTADSEAEMIAMLEKYGIVSSVASV